jgi:hypothetical protein
MVSKDGRGLKQRFVRRDAPVRPDVEDQLVVVGALANPRVLDRVFDTGDGRENRVDGNDADRLVGMLVFVSGCETASHLDFELGVKLLLPVERADVLLGIDDVNALHALDVGRRDGALLVTEMVAARASWSGALNFTFLRLRMISLRLPPRRASW